MTATSEPDPLDSVAAELRVAQAQLDAVRRAGWDALPADDKCRQAYEHVLASARLLEEHARMVGLRA